MSEIVYPEIISDCPLRRLSRFFGWLIESKSDQGKMSVNDFSTYDHVALFGDMLVNSFEKVKWGHIFSGSFSLSL